MLSPTTFSRVVEGEKREGATERGNFGTAGKGSQGGQALSGRVLAQQQQIPPASLALARRNDIVVCVLGKDGSTTREAATPPRALLTMTIVLACV